MWSLLIISPTKNLSKQFPGILASQSERSIDEANHTSLTMKTKSLLSRCCGTNQMELIELIEHLRKGVSNIETLIFCSQTLRSKVQRDFEELPSEAFGPLRDSVYKLLKRFNKGPPKVRTQISIAVASLAVHVFVEAWGGGGIVNWLSDEMRSHPEYIPVFLEVLTVLPQEVFSYKIAARPERRRQFEKELALSAEVAFGLFSACLGFDELKEQILDAFASWLHLNHRFPAAILASHPLVHAALSCLNSEDTSAKEAAHKSTMALTEARLLYGMSRHCYKLAAEAQLY